MNRTVLYVTALIIVFLSLTFALESMTAEIVVANMLTAYEKQMANIQDLTIVSNINTKYHKRAAVDGETVYKMRTEMDIGADQKLITVWDGSYQWWINEKGQVENQKEKFDRGEVVHQLLGAETEYIGKDSFDGYDTHVLSVKGLDMQESNESSKRMDGKVWIDANDWIPRKLELIIPSDDSEDEDKHDTLTVLMEDYRSFEGMLVPFVTKMITDYSPEMTPEERQEMREKLEEMERDFEQLPEEQKELLNSGGMWETHINTMKEALETGKIVMTLEVNEVQVNTGLADEMFDGGLLGQ